MVVQTFTPNAVIHTLHRHPHLDRHPHLNRHPERSEGSLYSVAAATIFPEAMPQYGCVYILASKGKRLYVGITTHLERRICQHKAKADPHCFTARYNINQLVYLERHPLITAAIAREKELKAGCERGRSP